MFVLLTSCNHHADIVQHLWCRGLDLYPNPANIQFKQVNILDLGSPSAESLEPYRQSVEVISLNLVLHTLNKEQGPGILASCASLLAPGGIILGLCVGSPEARPWAEWAPERWLHSPASLKEALSVAGFQQIRAEATNMDAIFPDVESDNLLHISFSAETPSHSEMPPKQCW